MIPRVALQERQAEWGLTEEVVEKDYVLGWLLWGIGANPRLRDTWIFKGGTCLKKCFVETYRFSEDLDFTVLEGGPLMPEDLQPVLVNMLDVVEQKTGIALLGRPPVIRLRPGDRSAEGRIYYRGPRGAPGEAKVKLDLTHDETVVDSTVQRNIAHPYEDALPGEATVRCYSFAEVFAEKLRALVERTRPRDLYDAVNLYRRADLRGDRALVISILERKCAFKGISMPTLATVSATEKIAELSADWQSMLGHQLPTLPPVDEFVAALDELFGWLGGGESIELDSVPAGREQIESTWVAPATIAWWPGGAPLEKIRFAGANHLLVELRYLYAPDRALCLTSLQSWKSFDLRDQSPDGRGPGLPRRQNRRGAHHRSSLRSALRQRTFRRTPREDRAAAFGLSARRALEGQGLGYFGETRSPFIALAEQGVLDLPVDPHVGVVPGDAGLGQRVVVAGEQVGNVGNLTEHGEAVAEPDRDEELAVLLVVEDVRLPLAVGGRAPAQVDGDVEDRAARAADQLRLARLGLEVNPTQGPLGGAGVVVLDELDPDAVLGPEAVTVGLDHEAAGVTVDRWLQQHHPVELRRQHLRH
jgi:predicted nucleotidyltransferase component of viral defense system